MVCIVSENSISPWFENIANSTAHWKKCFGRKMAASEDFKRKCREDKKKMQLIKKGGKDEQKMML